VKYVGYEHSDGNEWKLLPVPKGKSQLVSGLYMLMCLLLWIKWMEEEICNRKVLMIISLCTLM
jgi:hypothetical protein